MEGTSLDQDVEVEGNRSCGGSCGRAPILVDHSVVEGDLDGHDPRRPLALQVDDLVPWLRTGEAIFGHSSLDRDQHVAVEEDS